MEKEIEKIVMQEPTQSEEKETECPMRRKNVISRSRYISNINEIIKKFMTKSSMDGLPNLISSDGWLKSVWLLSIICSTTVCFYFMFRTIDNYLDYNVTTTTTAITEIPAPFPQVSFCNANSFMSNESVKFAESILKQNNLSTSLDSSHQLLTTLFYRYFIGTSTMSTNLTDSYRQKLSLTLDQMMISCTYSLQSCESRDFSWYWDAIYGSCFKFNHRGNVTSHKAGEINGLRIELFVGQPLSPASFAFVNGARVVINNNTFNPPTFDGPFLQSGAYTSIMINREFNQRLPYPYSDCQRNIEQLDSYIVKATINRHGGYTQTNCFDMCFQTYVVKKCGCLDMIEGSPFDAVPYCVNVSQVDCSFGYYAQFDPKSMCQDMCPLECDDMKYILTVSSAKYPSRSYYEKLLNSSAVQSYFNESTSSITYETLRENVLALSVFYQKLGYTLVNESPTYSWTDLIGSVGGTLGLFIGISFMSFVELTELAIYLISATLKYLKDAN